MANTMKVVVFVYTIVNIVIGLGLTAVGIWLHAQADINAYMTVFVRSLTDSSLRASAGLLLATGIILLLISIVGLFGVLKDHRGLLTLYLWFQPVVLVLGITAGFLTVALYWNIHTEVKAGMQAQISQSYGSNNQLTKAWNRVQVKKRCCGADGPWDYQNSGWFNGNNPIDQDASTLVPDSCCALNFNQDTTLYWVDPEKLQLKDGLRCQQDAAGNIGRSANLNNKGCFAALFKSNPDLRDYWRNIYLDVSIFTVISVIQGLGLSAGFLQVFGILLTWFYIGSLRQTLRQLRVNKR